MLDNGIPEPDGGDWMNDTEEGVEGVESALDEFLDGEESETESDEETPAEDESGKSDKAEDDNSDESDDEDDDEEEDESEEEEKPEEEAKEDSPVEETPEAEIEGESDEADFESIPEEVIKEKERTFVERERYIVDKVVEKYKPQVQQIYSYKQNLTAELQAIESKENEVDEDGFKAQLTLADFKRVAAIESELKELARIETQVLAQAQEDEQRYKYENWIRVNLDAYPKLAKYEAEVRSLLGKGFNPESVEELYDVAKAKYDRANKGQTPAKKPMSKKQVVEKTLEKQLERKQRAKVSTAKGGSGLVKSAPKNSNSSGDGLDPRLSDMLSYTKNYLNRKG